MQRAILLYLTSFVLVALSAPLVHAATPKDQYRKAISVLVGGSDRQSDLDDAARLLRSAADSGYPPAQTALGSVYEQGIAVSQDTQQAIGWYKKAAEQGDWIAQFSLGRLYFQGGPISRDTLMAKKWLELAAADERDNGAAFYLGLLYDDGQGTATNYSVAEKWYRRAANRGNSFAMEKLGLLLLRGVIAQPGSATREEAYVYLITAAALGNHNVDQQLRSMEADLGKKSADAAREKSLDLRERVNSYSRMKCGGWDGQFSGAPTPPPLNFQIDCEQ